MRRYSTIASVGILFAQTQLCMGSLELIGVAFLVVFFAMVRYKSGNGQPWIQHTHTSHSADAGTPGIHTVPCTCQGYTQSPGAHGLAH